VAVGWSVEHGLSPAQVAATGPRLAFESLRASARRERGVYLHHQHHTRAMPARHLFLRFLRAGRLLGVGEAQGAWPSESSHELTTMVDWRCGGHCCASEYRAPTARGYLRRATRLGPIRLQRDRRSRGHGLDRYRKTSRAVSRTRASIRSSLFTVFDYASRTRIGPIHRTQRLPATGSTSRAT
jgi:hypothetical protein